MSATEQARQLADRLASTRLNRTRIRAIADECGKNQATADELWMHGETSARLLALLILGLKAIGSQSIERTIAAIEAAEGRDQRQLCDLLIASVI